MKNLFVIVVLYGLLFSFFSMGLDNPPIRRLPGTTYNQYSNYSSVVVMHCHCYHVSPEDDLWIDDYMGQVRIVGINNHDARTNALQVCHELHGTHWAEFVLKKCESKMVNTNNANNPKLGATHVLSRSTLFVPGRSLDATFDFEILEFTFRN